MLESIYGTQTGRSRPGSSLSSYLSTVAPPHGIQAGGGPATAPGLGNSSLNGGGAPERPAAAGATLPSWLGQLLTSRGNFQADQQTPGVSTDYSSDPALQQLLMGFDKNEADAESQALTARRNTLAKYGDVNLARKVLGPGDPLVDTISADPDKSTSTLARLARAYRDTVGKNEEDLNSNNLFYGGYRTKTLGNLAKDEQTQEADASSAVQDALGQIASGLQGTLENIAEKRAGAEGDAYARAQQDAFAKAMLASGQPSTPQPPATDTGAPRAASTTTGSTGVDTSDVVGRYLNNLFTRGY